jgi:hypothetical protein
MKIFFSQNSRFYFRFTLIVVLLLALPAAGMVYANSPKITLSPVVGPVSTAIAVYGDGFPANQSGEAFFDTNLDGIRNNNEPFISVSTDSAGALTATGTLTVPSVSPGYYPVRVTLSGNVTAYTFFVVRQPVLTTGKNKGVPGTAVIISGRDFAVNSSGWVWFDTNKNYLKDPGEPAMFVTTDGTGSFTGYLTIPNVASGAYPIIADLTNNGKNIGLTSFTVGSGMTLSPTSGLPGTVITITGGGYGPGDYLVWLDINNDSVPNINESQITVTSVDGKITASLIVPPGTLPGTYPVKISQYDTVNGTIYGAYKGSPNFIVSGPGLLLNPGKGKPGTIITIQGSRFPANATGQLWFDINGNYTKDPDETAKSVTTNRYGGFVTTITIPSIQAGAYKLVAEFTDSSAKAAAPVTVLAPPSISLSVTSGSPDTVIIVNGKDFNPWTSTVVWFDLNGNGKKDTKEPARTVKTDGFGRFRAVLTTPHAIKPGAYVIYVSAPPWSGPLAYADFFVNTGQSQGAATPVVTIAAPSNGAEKVQRYPTVKLTFNTQIIKGPDFGSITLIDEDGNIIAHNATVKGRVLQIKPGGILKELKTYLLTVPAQAVLNSRSAGMEEDYTLSFTTQGMNKGTTINIGN